MVMPDSQSRSLQWEGSRESNATRSLQRINPNLPQSLSPQHIPSSDPAEGLLRADVQVDDAVGAAHEARHGRERLDVRVVVTGVHRTRVPQHLGKDGVLKDGSVLDSTLAGPHDLLLLLEAGVEEEDLHRKRVFGHVLVKVGQVDVV